MIWECVNQRWFDASLSGSQLICTTLSEKRWKFLVPLLMQVWLGYKMTAKWKDFVAFCATHVFA